MQGKDHKNLIYQQQGTIKIGRGRMENSIHKHWRSAVSYSKVNEYLRENNSDIMILAETKFKVIKTYLTTLAKIITT